MSSKKGWPAPESERIPMSKLFNELDRARRNMASARQGGDEDTIDDAAMAMFKANEKIQEYIARFADRPIHEDENGWIGLGVKELAATKGDDIYDGLLPNLFVLDDGWLPLTGDETDRPEDPGGKEYEEIEAWVRVMAKTGWPGLNKRQRDWLTKVRDQARTLANKLEDWLECTK